MAEIIPFPVPAAGAAPGHVSLTDLPGFGAPEAIAEYLAEFRFAPTEAPDFRADHLIRWLWEKGFAVARIPFVSTKPL